MKNIITIRHTQTVNHVNSMVGSWTDWELTDLGKERAGNIGRRLAVELADMPCKIYCSDLTRTRQTVEPLLLGLAGRPKCFSVPGFTLPPAAFRSCAKRMTASV